MSSSAWRHADQLVDCEYLLYPVMARYICRCRLENHFNE